MKGVLLGTMKGVILAGGNGTRLLPMTKSVNKHLLPVGGKPMLQHCIEKMTEAGIKDVLVVTGGEHLGGIAEFLGSGKEFKCNVTYRVQDEAGGIAQALALADGFIQHGDTMCVLLGDNIFESSLRPMIENYQANRANYEGAMVVLNRVSDPQRFGVASMGEVKRRNEKKDWTQIGIVQIEEKPKHPKTNLVVTGIYFYDSSVFNIIRQQKPSGRGEMEITDVNNAYIKALSLGHWEMLGWWTDAGTHDSYQKANALVLKTCGVP